MLMPVLRFPDPEDADPSGIVAIGGDLHPTTLLRAYRAGIFPWPMPGLPLTWFSPDPRAGLLFDEVHVGKRLARTRRLSGLRLTIDSAFDDVIRHCAEVPRPDQPGASLQPEAAPEGDEGEPYNGETVAEPRTWITPEVLRAYCEFHRLGHAHSCEAWDGDRLVGGLYGVDVDGAFAGESMFRLEPDASKLALLHLIDHLRARGLEWIDIQVMTPHMKAMGAREIPRRKYLELLAETRARGVRSFSSCRAAASPPRRHRG